MINKHTVDYHPSPSGLASRIHPLKFLWTPQVFISPDYLLNFFSDLYVPIWLGKIFKFMVLRLLENAFVSQNLNLFIFTHTPKQNSPLGSHHHSLPSSQKETTHFSRQRFFQNLFPPIIKGEETMKDIIIYKPHHLCTPSHFQFQFCCAIIQIQTQLDSNEVWKFF